MDIILLTIIQFIFETIFFITGEIVLYLITLGGRKISWNFDLGAESSLLGSITETSILVGFITWLLIIIFSILIYFKLN